MELCETSKGKTNKGGGMTTKTLAMLEQLNALKDYLEENADGLNDRQAGALGMAIATCWEIACRRSERRHRQAL